MLETALEAHKPHDAAPDERGSSADLAVPGESVVRGSLEAPGATAPEAQPLPFTMRLHHVGYVVADIESSARGFMHSLGMSWDGKIFADPRQRVKVTFLATGPNCAQIELVEPAGDTSPVAKFLARGGGQHHVCYEVDDIEEALTAFRKRNASIAQRPSPAVAFDGRRIAWFITREKLVVELLETSLPK